MALLTEMRPPLSLDDTVLADTLSLVVMTHRRVHPCRLASCQAASIKAVPAPCHCSPACRVMFGC